MSKRTLKEFKAGPGTRGPVIRKKKPYGAKPKVDLVTKAEEKLTDLAEQEAAAEEANLNADLDSAMAGEV